MLAHAVLAAAGAALGYATGRYQPARRASDWANWQRYDSTIRKHSARWWARYAVLSAENLTWLAFHPVQGWHAWQYRNDPPPPLAPAPQINPTWAAERSVGRVECGVSVQNWWCQLDLGHSGGCIPRRFGEA